MTSLDDLTTSYRKALKKEETEEETEEEIKAKKQSLNTPI